ncbi:hypothetical protein QYE76_013664 [Lolium multiflorum]|uniref:Uncharacterized protein n=1 Tax=Lolium multiflorum TaxID=4521 RepID=A0AAD8U1K7_LOLMU|nr:hypothetical protein QYE76_013664 [Lolium multiflorum]
MEKAGDGRDLDRALLEVEAGDGTRWSRKGMDWAVRLRSWRPATERLAKVEPGNELGSRMWSPATGGARRGGDRRQGVVQAHLHAGLRGEEMRLEKIRKNVGDPPGNEAIVSLLTRTTVCR